MLYLTKRKNLNGSILIRLNMKIQCGKLLTINTYHNFDEKQLIFTILTLYFSKTVQEKNLEAKNHFTKKRTPSPRIPTGDIIN